MKPEPPRMRRRPLFHARNADAWPILYGVKERFAHLTGSPAIFFAESLDAAPHK